MNNQIYTIGYQGRRVDWLINKAKELNAVIFDIRYAARSRNPDWNKSNIAGWCEFHHLENGYTHVKELGNVNYKSGPIKIFDYEAGKSLIAETLLKSSVILMCICFNPLDCHRTTIANKLRSDGYQVTEINHVQNKLW